jgi:hypothetical protein
MRLVAVAVLPVWDRVEIDARLVDRGLQLGPLLRGTFAWEVPPRLHRSVFRRARYACTHRV